MVRVAFEVDEFAVARRADRAAAAGAVAADVRHFLDVTQLVGLLRYLSGKGRARGGTDSTAAEHQSALEETSA